MEWLELKRGTALVLGTLNLTLLVMAARAYRLRLPMPPGYYRLVPLSTLTAALLLAMGLTFLTQGRLVPGMHIFYGAAIVTGVAAQGALALQPNLRQRYMARQVIHGFLALFVLLLTARAWMVA